MLPFVPAFHFPSEHRAAARIPTIRGAISLHVRRMDGEFRMEIDLPASMSARVMVPAGDSGTTVVEVDGKSWPARMEGRFLVVDPVGSGRHVVSARRGSGA